MSLSKKTSSVWSHFTVVEGTHFAKCDICKHKYSFKTSVTNLKTHLAKAHWILMTSIQVSNLILKEYIIKSKLKR